MERAVTMALKAFDDRQVCVVVLCPVCAPRLIRIGSTLVSWPEVITNQGVVCSVS